MTYVIFPCYIPPSKLYRQGFNHTANCIYLPLHKPLFFVVNNAFINFIYFTSSSCYHQDLLCDGYVQCKDGSDEDPNICGSCPIAKGYPPSMRPYATFPCRFEHKIELIVKYTLGL